jgi:hypothetical protein
MKLVFNNIQLNLNGLCVSKKHSSSGGMIKCGLDSSGSG